MKSDVSYISMNNIRKVFGKVVANKVADKTGTAQTVLFKLGKVGCKSCYGGAVCDSFSARGRCTVVNIRQDAGVVIKKL